MLQQKLRNRRSSSLSSLAQSNASIYDILESNQCKFSQSQKKLKQIYAILKPYQSKRQSIQNRCFVSIKRQDYELTINNLKSAIQKISKMNISYDHVFTKLQQQNNKIKQLKDKQTRCLILKHQQQTKFSQSQYNKNLMSINSEFSKKQQYYKQLFTNFVQSLNKAQRIWTMSFSSIQQKSRNLIDFVIKNCQEEIKHKQIYQQIVELTNQLNIKKQINDSLFSKRSQDFSAIQFSPVMINNNHKSFKFQDKKNTIQMSCIQPIQQQQQDIDIETRQLQNALRSLISLGFFSPQNKKYVQKMFQISENLEGEYIELLNDPIYPLVIQFLKSNINREMSQRSMQNDIIQQESISFHSPLPSNRDNTGDSIISRHLDLDQLIQNNEQQKRQNNTSNKNNKDNESRLQSQMEMQNQRIFMKKKN